MVLLIDNYDSFSYNLYQLAGSLGAEIKVARNDAIDLPGIVRLSPSHVILSPGPGRPEDAGITVAAARELAAITGRPVLGVCLGHQAICAAFGARIVHARTLMHGKQSLARLSGDSRLFAGLPGAIKVARYHSLAADPATMPDCLKVTATADDGEIMAVEHVAFPLYGVQFHPESILTPDGAAIMSNFLAL
ncbi:MAG: aminodeoxychorismate/anthranilate synthase component II [Kiritimatiellae bacterium]|nr:aminodeoxychorismate/anthranilate synthase component II [Kiritimatiellia bacterium]